MSGVNRSRWIAFDGTFFEMPSPRAASALNLARIHREGYSDGDLNHPPDIEKSDSWYDRAFEFHVPAVLIGASLVDSFEEHDTALKWFAREAKMSRHIRFAHYKMGRSYEALKRYSEAVTSYGKAAAMEPETEEDYQQGDYKFAILAALRLGWIHLRGIPEAGITSNDDLSDNFYKKAFRMSEWARQMAYQMSEKEYKEADMWMYKKGKSWYQRIRDVLVVGDYSLVSEPLPRHVVFQPGIPVALLVATDYHRAYKKRFLYYDKVSARRNALQRAIFWYDKAYGNKEMSSEGHREAVYRLKNQLDPSPTAKEFCEIAWENWRASEGGHLRGGNVIER